MEKIKINEISTEDKLYALHDYDKKRKQRIYKLG
jgi:hypothetical protein